MLLRKRKQNAMYITNNLGVLIHWVEVETGVKYRKLGENEKGGY